MRPLALMSWWKLRNSLRTLLTDPRKLIPLLFIGGSMLCSFGSMFLTTMAPRPASMLQTVDPGMLHAVTALAMVAVGVIVFNIGLGDNLIAFGMPDVDYVFPSPISRRAVMAYRLPTLTWGALMSGGLIVLMYSMFFRISGAQLPHMGSTPAPPGSTLLIATLCVGIYLNVALYLAIRVKNRELWHKILTGALLAFLIGVGVVWWQIGAIPAERLIGSDWVRWPLLPSTLASDAIYNCVAHEPIGRPLVGLAIGYALSLAPLLLTRINFYEQSIASSERVSALRTAAKGGYASLMAARAANYKHKASRDFTIAPFGQGAMALFWAHLAAAAKKPWATFATPLVGGVVAGILGAEANRVQTGLGVGAIAAAAFYASIGFLAAGKTASEAAIRRRELLSPLPIPSWQSVAANLGVPFMIVTLFACGATVAYALDGGAMPGMVAFGLLLLFPLRTMGRMTLQYGLVLNFGDLADKVQQLMSGLVYYLAATPLAIAEFIICIPAIVLRSPWIAIIGVTLLNVPILIGMLALVGKAAARAVASGEPVSLWSMLGR